MLLISPLLALVNAQASWVMWSQTYGGTSEDNIYSMVETSDGGYALAGRTYSFGVELCDFWLIKTDAVGNMMWNRTYGGEDYDIAYSLIQTSDGGYALAGKTFGAGAYDFWLVKTDANGNMEWNQTFGGETYDSAFSLVETSDGGYVIAGDTLSYGAGDYDAWLVKTDEQGNMDWSRTYGGAALDSVSSLVVASDGGYVLAGRKASLGTGYSYAWLFKTDVAGNIVWNQTYGEGSDGDEANSLVKTSDGGYAIAGRVYSFGAGESDFWLIKTDANGNMEWNQTYGEERHEVPNSVIETSDGGYALSGLKHFIEYGFGHSDVWLVKTNASGNMQWTRFYGGEDNDVAHSLIEVSDGGFALAGETDSFGAGNYDALLIKINEQGIPEFPSWFILPIFFTAILFAIILKKRMVHARP